MAAPIQKVNCPICGKEFGLSSINQHIDLCLTDSTDPESTSETRKRFFGDCQATNKRRKTDNSKSNGNFEKVENESSASDGQKVIDVENGNVELIKDVSDRKPAPKRNWTGSSAKLPISESASSSFFSLRSVPKRSLVTSSMNSTSSKSAAKQESIDKKAINPSAQPLAEIMRPNDLSQYMGQVNVVGENKQLQMLLSTKNYMSMIFWGPPGCGKTTLARIIATQAKSDGYRFVTMSATTSGVADIKTVMTAAKNDLKSFRRRTILFVDEIHHFNKTQQDTFLPFVEEGTVILLGATTENPSFQLNNALLSRCRVVVLDKLTPDNIRNILQRALEHLNVEIVKDEETATESTTSGPRITSAAVEQLSFLCDGDARSALNCLEMALRAAEHGRAGDIAAGRDRLVTVQSVMEALQRRVVQYDRAGEEHYNCASALQKSIRGGSDQGALYWVARMMEGGEDPLYIARRLVRTASEDIGLADPMALTHAMAAFHACQALGKKECDVILAQCAVYLARAPRSNEVYSAYNAAVKSIREHQGSLPGVPLHLRNAPTRLLKDLGYGKSYRYDAEPGEQSYLPDGMQHVNFFNVKQ